MISEGFIFQIKQPRYLSKFDSQMAIHVKTNNDEKLLSMDEIYAILLVSQNACIS